MSGYRDAVLEGTLEAEQVHADSPRSLASIASGEAVDVFRFIDERDITLVFQKLGGLLGAFMRFGRPGILVTTTRSLSIQRFTAAHELGHAVLNHGNGFDDDSILGRTPFGGTRYDNKEMAADTFAAMFLMPEPLINAIATRQKWNATSIRRPEIVYQFSLRLGVSYEALVRTLPKYGMISRQEMHTLLRVPVKQVKQKLLDGSVQPVDWRCNVWELTEKDIDTLLIAEPNDYFVVRLREMSGAGYLWDVDGVKNAGFQIVSDQRYLSPGEDIGSDAERVFTARALSPQSSSFTAIQARPWDSNDIAGEFRLHMDVNKVDVGFTERHRLEALAA